MRKIWKILTYYTAEQQIERKLNKWRREYDEMSDYDRAGVDAAKREIDRGIARREKERIALGLEPWEYAAHQEARGE